MFDSQKWKIAVSRFTGYCGNLPAFPKTEEVEDYHAIVKALEEASGQDLSSFKIPPEKHKPKLVSFRPASYGGARGSSNYSRDKYCDSDFFQAQIDALKHYLPTIETTGPKTEYDDLKDWQLQELMVQRHIKPSQPKDGGHARMPSREYIIAALVKQDKQDNPTPPAAHTTTFNVYDSNFNYASPGATITSSIGTFTKEEFTNLVGGLRQLLSEEKLDEGSRNEIRINIGTIELQLGSAQPNRLRQRCKTLRVR